MKDPQSMTVAELRELQAARYKAAGDDGTLRLLRLVAMELGVPLQAKYGPKWNWASGNVEIYRDDYGGYTTVHADGRLVCSTHECTKLFVPGSWVDTVKQFARDVLLTQEARAAEQNERERHELLEKLGLLNVTQPPLPSHDVLGQ